MKVFKDNKVYVQMHDVVFIMHNNEGVPSVIIDQVFKDVVICLDCSEFISLNGKEAIDYFKGVDYILDYADYKNLSIPQIESKAKIVIDKMGDIADKFNSLSQSQQNKHQDLVGEYKNLEHIIDCLGEIIRYKSGLNEMNIPGEIIKEVTKTEINYDMPTQIDVPKKKTVKTFIKEKIFNKR